MRPTGEDIRALCVIAGVSNSDLAKATGRSLRQTERVQSSDRIHGSTFRRYTGAALELSRVRYEKAVAYLTELGYGEQFAQAGGQDVQADT